MSHVNLPVLQILTDGEEFDLEECETAIEAGMEHFWQVLLSLAKIREMKLWRKHFKSFGDYCEQRWGMTRRRMDQLLKAYEVREALDPELASLITNERQARQLSRVPPQQRSQVMQAAAQAGDVSANGIARAVAQTPRVLRETIYDEIGEIIPDDAVPFWKRRDEVQEILSMITKIKSAVKDAIEKEDPMYYRLTNSTIMELGQLYSRISDAKPYAVCTVCMGHPSLQPHGCGNCGNRGLISKFQWDTQTPKEIKELRLKAIAARTQKL